MSKTRVGVILAGCGYLDGAEVQESVLTLLALDQAGVEAVCMAPRMQEAPTTNHVTGETTPCIRDVFEESARIVRGNIQGINQISAGSLDALIFPGGYGVAKNLCTFAEQGTDMTIHKDVEQKILEVHAAGKPMGFICIAPVLAAKLIPGVRVTIGNDRETAKAIGAMGAVHVDCAVEDIVVDEANKVVTTPAYMLGPWTAAVHKGIDACVKQVLAMAG